MSILWRAAAELGDDDWPECEACHCGREMPWELTKWPMEQQGAARHCDRCGAPWFRV